MYPPENLSGLPGELYEVGGVTASVEETPPFRLPLLQQQPHQLPCLFQTYHAGSYPRAFALAVPSRFVPFFTQLIPTETQAQTPKCCHLQEPFLKLP